MYGCIIVFMLDYIIIQHGCHSYDPGHRRTLRGGVRWGSGGLYGLFWVRLKTPYKIPPYKEITAVHCTVGVRCASFSVYGGTCTVEKIG